MGKKKNIHRKCLRTMLIMGVTAWICIGMNLCAFLIDTPHMRENAGQGVQMMAETAQNNELVGGFEAAHMDQFTSVLMLKTAAYTGEEPLWEKAFGGMRVDMPAEDEQDEWTAFCIYADGTQSPTGGGMGYGRYWHGYTLPLRLLLSMFNMANVQMLLYAAQFGLILLTVYAMAKSGLSRLIPAFALSWFLMMPAAMGLCFQYAAASLMTLCACCLLLLYGKRWEKAFGMPSLFALTGLLTNYFDLLSFPLISLVYPMILLLARRTQENRSIWQMVWEAFLCAACWGTAYAGMWVFKWIINAVVFGAGAFAQVTDQIALRLSTSSGGQTFTRVGVMVKDMEVITEKAAYLALLLAAGVFLCAHAICCGILGKTRFNPRGFMLLIPAVLPFAWTAVMPNHGYDHFYFVYRIFSGTVFSLLSAPILWTTKRRIPEIREDGTDN